MMTEIDVYGNSKAEYRRRIKETEINLALWKERLKHFMPMPKMEVEHQKEIEIAEKEEEEKERKLNFDLTGN
jgi:hypothetical protein